MPEKDNAKLVIRTRTEDGIPKDIVIEGIDNVIHVLDMAGKLIDQFETVLVC